MGGQLATLFSGAGAGAGGAPTLLQKLAQGTAKGAGRGVGTALQQGSQPATPGSSVLPAGPGSTPVDAGYFSPTNYGQDPPSAWNRYLPQSNFNGVRDSMMQAPQNAFYGG